MSDEPRIHVSLGMKVNTGNYENQDVSIGIAGVPYDASPEYVADVKAKGIRTIQSMTEILAGEMYRIRTEDFGK